MVNIGFVGAGFIGQLAHLQNYIEIPECNVTALAEIRPELREKVRSRYGIDNTYPTHVDLLNESNVDAIIAVTRRPNTGPIAENCLKANKHLLTEKPMAGTLAQARKLVGIAERMNVIYSVGYMRRHDAGVQEAKKILNELQATKEFGDIIFYKAHCFGGDPYCNADGHIKTDEPYPEDLYGWPIGPDWLPEERWQEFAWFLNVYVHNINMMRYLLDLTPNVEYTNFKHKNGQVIMFDFENFCGLLEIGESTSRFWDEYFEIYFEKGKLKVSLPNNLLRNVPAQVELYKGNEQHSLIKIVPEWSWSFRRQAEAFVNDILSKNTPLNNAKNALKDMELIEKIWECEMSN